MKVCNTPPERRLVPPSVCQAERQLTMHDHTPGAERTAEEAGLFWENHYSGREQVWSGDPNPHLVETARELEPLRPGSGVRRGRRRGLAGRAPLAGDRGRHLPQRPVPHHLVRGRRRRRGPAHHRSSRHGEHLPRRHVRPGQRPVPADPVRTAPRGRLPEGRGDADAGWAAADRRPPARSARGWNAHPETRFPGPEEIFGRLGLDPARWEAERLDSPQREAAGPDGETATVTDNVIVVRRLTA